MDEDETAEALKEVKSETSSFASESLQESSFEKFLPASQDSQCTLSSNATTSSIDSRSQDFPHCAICGFNVEVYLLHYRRIRPPTNNNWIFRFKCRRKTCSKFFGHSWIKNKSGEFEIINEDATFECLPFFSRFNPDIDPAEYNKITTPRLADQHGRVQRGRPKKSISPSLARGRSPVRGAPIKISLASAAKSSADKPLLLQDQDELKTPIDECTSESTDVTVNKCKDEPFDQSEVPERPKSQKGYAYVLEFVPHEEDLPKEKKTARPKRIKPLKHDGIKEFGVSNASPRVSSPNDASIRRFHCWTQTMDLAHVTSFAIDEAMKRNVKEEEQITSEINALEPGPSTSTNMEAGLARRLIVASHVIDQARKSEEKMRGERDRLKDALTLLLTQMHSLKRQYIEDTRRIRDDVDAAKHEMRTYHGELGIQANMIKNVIAEVKKAQGEKLNDIQKDNKKLKGQLELKETKYQQVEAQSNRYHRELQERDRKVALVTAEKLEVAKKLEDKLFLNNNQKCFHCTESSNLKNFYEKQAKTKAETVDKLEAENRKLISELEGCQQIVTTLKKNEGRLKYERDTYEAENRRLLTRLGIKKTEEENTIKNDQPSRSSDGTKSVSPQIHSSPNGHAVPSQPPKQTQATHKLPPLPTFAPLSTTDQVPVAFANWITKPKPAEPLGKTMTDQQQQQQKLQSKAKKLEKQENPEAQASTEKVEPQATKETTVPEPTTSQIPAKKPRVETPPIISNGSTSSIAKERVNSPVPNAQPIKKIVSPSPQNGPIAKKPLLASGGSKIAPPKANSAQNKVASRPTSFDNAPKPVVKPSWLQHEARQNAHRPHPNEPAPNIGRYWNPQVPVNGPVNPPPPGVDWNRDAGLPWHRGPNVPNEPFNPPSSNYTST